MFVRSIKRLIPAIAVLLILSIVLFKSYDKSLQDLSFKDILGPKPLTGADGQQLHLPPSAAIPGTLDPALNLPPAPNADSPLINLPPPPTSSSQDTLIPTVNNGLATPDLLYDASATHRVVKSVSTKNGAYFPINWGTGERAINPNIVPHPYLDDTWLVVAQRLHPPRAPATAVFYVELVCSAKFKNDVLECLSPPIILPIAATPNGGHCEGPISFFALNIGPHDARVFWGPEIPYVIFGSNSVHTCLGMWAQDFRMLTDFGGGIEETPFRSAIELQRPAGSWSSVEKNWFFFFDWNNDTYVHFDIAPKRAYAKLEPDGSVGPDLAPQATTDAQCIEKYMPKVEPEAHEKVHQSTNSLAVTLCERSDSTCTPSEANTFAMTIYQHKKYVGMFGAVYEPYIALFSRTAPYALFALGTKPFWISGRGGYADRGNPASMQEAGTEIFNRTEMLYISSFAWRDKGLKYQGFKDDVLMINFGIEDNKTAAIDIKADDLLQDLSPCAAAAGHLQGNS